MIRYSWLTVLITRAGFEVGLICGLWLRVRFPTLTSVCWRHHIIAGIKKLIANCLSRFVLVMTETYMSILHWSSLVMTCGRCNSWAMHSWLTCSIKKLTSNAFHARTNVKRSVNQALVTFCIENKVVWPGQVLCSVVFHCSFTIAHILGALNLPWNQLLGGVSKISWRLSRTFQVFSPSVAFQEFFLLHGIPDITSARVLRHPNADLLLSRASEIFRCCCDRS